MHLDQDARERAFVDQDARVRFCGSRLACAADPPARSGAFEASQERSTRSSAANARAPGSSDLSYGSQGRFEAGTSDHLSCRLSSMAERCVVAAETLDRYRQAVPDIGRVAHRQSGGLQNRAREGSIPSSPANHLVRLLL